MAIALFISLSELKKNTALSGNIDADKLLPMLKAVQELEVTQILGTDLYNKLSDDIIAGSVTGAYLTLKNDYIHSYLIHEAVANYIPYASYQISNGGMSKWKSDSRESLNISEVNYMMAKETSMAERYKKRLIDYLCENNSSFPEYSTNTGADISPVKTTNNTNWYFGPTRKSHTHLDENY